MPSQALQFTILTAARTSEVLGARTDEFDLCKLIWQVPRDRMKAQMPHQVPLSDTAAELVESVMSPDNAPHGTGKPDFYDVIAITHCTIGDERRLLFLWFR